jgi:hypothetical protein
MQMHAHTKMFAFTYTYTYTQETPSPGCAPRPMWLTRVCGARPCYYMTAADDASVRPSRTSPSLSHSHTHTLTLADACTHARARDRVCCRRGLRLQRLLLRRTRICGQRSRQRSMWPSARPNPSFALSGSSWKGRCVQPKPRTFVRGCRMRVCMGAYERVCVCPSLPLFRTCFDCSHARTLALWWLGRTAGSAAGGCGHTAARWRGQDAHHSRLSHAGTVRPAWCVPALEGPKPSLSLLPTDAHAHTQAHAHTHTLSPMQRATH